MTFERPTLSTLIERARGDFESRLPGADSRLRASFLDVLARMHAGAASGLYGYLDWLARQLMPDTAEAAHLERWASIWGVFRKAATPAAGTATASGTDGTIVPAGTELLRIDGARYRVIEDATIEEGSAEFPIEAVATGPAGNLTEGGTLTLATAIGGANAAVTIAEVTASGTVDESDADLLARLLDRIRRPPQGGSRNDYVQWALALPGVTRAWAWQGWMGAGSVGVAFVMDDRVDILPLEADVEAVQGALDVLRPVTAALYVFAPTAFPVDVQLRLSPDTPETRAAVTAELRDAFHRDAEPGGTVRVSRLGEAVSLAQGEGHHTLEMPSNDLTAGPGAIPVLGDVEFLA